MISRMSFFSYYIYLLLFFCFYAPLYTLEPCKPCLQKNSPIQNEQPASNEVWLTIFVHGIMSVAPHLNFKNLTRFMCDDIIDTVYAHTVNFMRKDPFFYMNQAMGDFGIQPLNPNDLERGKAGNVIARIYDEMTRLFNPDQQCNYYYTYGWSGLLSVSQRYYEAEGLFIGIHQLIQKCKIYGIKPKIRVVGYSHGGNVCLNLAAIQQNKYPNIPITIDELILLGMPVQLETDYLVASPIFKKVYHIYSSVDRIQPLDIFSKKRLFSQRVFTPHRNFKLPDNLIQINVKINHLTCTKRDKQPLYRYATDFSKKTNISGQRRLWRDISPGHIELWFLGWASSKYRPDFPLNPLPTLVTIPFMIAELQKREPLLTSRSVIFDIRPEVNRALIKYYNQCRNIDIISFISPEQLEEFKAYAYSIQPEEYGSALYRKHINDALNAAKRLYHQQKTDFRKCKPYKRPRRFRRRKEDTCAADRIYRFDAEIE